MALSWWQRLVNGKHSENNQATRRGATRKITGRPLLLEELEGRLLLSASSLTAPPAGNSFTAGSNSPAALIATTTSWASTATPTIYGQTVVLQARVARSSGQGTPTGQVAFKEGSTVLGMATLDAAGLATFSISSLDAGTHAITASYVSNGQFAASSSPAQSQVVSPAHDLIFVQSSPPASYALSSGQEVTLTADVTGQTFGAGSPGGQVQFLDYGKPLGQPVTLDTMGNASLTTSFKGPSSHDITAKYLGDARFQAMTSAPLTLQVTATAKAASVTTVTAPATLVEGAALTLATQIAGATPGSPTPTGKVQFIVDGRNIGGPSTLDSVGKVNVSLRNLQVGNHTIVVVYLGDAHFSTSAKTLVVQVNAAHRSTTATKLTASANAAAIGQQVTFTAQITTAGSSGARPSGAVQFSVDGKDQGQPVALDLSGAASLSFTFTKSGIHTIAVRYPGDAHFAPSASPALTVTIAAAHQSATTTSLTVSTATAGFGQTVTLTATVAALGGKPGGKVQFLDNGTALGQSVTLDATGKAILRIASLTPGTHDITVRYLGSADFSASLSTAKTVKIARAWTDVVVKSSAAPAVTNQQVVLTAQVTAPDAGGATPTGKVQFLVNGVAWGQAVAVDASGKAVFSTSFGQTGTYHVTARYLGDADYGTSTSLVLIQQVNPPTQPDPDLARLIAAWPTLSASVRAAILALLQKA
jgi:hypothetical protein